MIGRPRQVLPVSCIENVTGRKSEAVLPRATDQTNGRETVTPELEEAITDTNSLDAQDLGKPATRSSSFRVRGASHSRSL